MILSRKTDAEYNAQKYWNKEENFMGRESHVDLSKTVIAMHDIVKKKCLVASIM